MKFRFLFRLFNAAVLCVGSIVTSSLNAKTLIMTHSFNRPEFISWQYHTFKKFVEGEFEFVVFNDAPNEELFNQIEGVCKALEIRSIPVPQNIHLLPYLYRDWAVCGPSAECAETIQYMLNSVGFNYPGIVLLVDSDMVLIRHLNIEKFLEGYEIAAHPQHRISPKGLVTYFLPNLLFFNMPELQDKSQINFGLGEVSGIRTDTGGFTHYYIKNNPELKWLQTDVFYPPLVEGASVPQPGALAELKSYKVLYELLQSTEYDYEFFADCNFLHFRAGSNWNNMEDTKMAAKTELFLRALRELLGSQPDTENLIDQPSDEDTFAYISSP